MKMRALVVPGMVFFLATPASANEVQLTLREGTNFAAALSAPDGSFVLDLQGTLWRLPAAGGPASALTDGMGDDRLPDVSRDGGRIVYQSYRNGTWDVWSAGIEGAGATALTEGASDDREPVLSPDGSRVAFSSDRSGNYDVWVLEIESGTLTPVTKHEANDSMPAWTPAGDEIVFVSDRRLDSGSERNVMTRLYRVAARADAEPVLVASFEGVVASPSVSPDGKFVALRVLELSSASADAMGRATESSRLALVPFPAGGGPRYLAAPEDVFPFRAQWSGRTELVFTARGSLWRQSIQEGSQPVQIPFEATVSLDRPPYARRPPEFPKGRERRPVRGLVRPVLSPDGTRIVYAALGDIWTVARGGEAGHDPTPLTRNEPLDTDPHWSPDGRSIVFSSDREGTMDLWAKDVEAPPGEGERRLTSSSGAEMCPAWSPDGRSIAFVDEESKLHVMAADGSEDRILTEARRGIGIPTWSSDSVHVAISVFVPISSRFREGYNRILIVDTKTGTSRLLDEPGRSFGTRDGDGPVWRPDGRSLAFAMDGGLWVLPVTPEGVVTGRPRQVLGEAVDFPSWSRDGTAIVFVGSGGLSEVELESGSARRVELRHDFEHSATAGRLVIRNVRLVDGTGAPPRDGMDVFVEGDRIERIEPTGAQPVEGVRVVDGAGKTLIPGLIEMHAHLSLPAWGSRQGKVWLSYGVTSLRTPADALYRALEERESIRAGRRVGPRIFYTGATLDGDRVYYTGGLAIGDSEELDQEIERALDLEYDLVKTYVRLPDTLQKEAIAKAHARGVFVTSHEVYPAVAYGVDGIEHLSGTSRRGFSPKLTQMRRTYDDVIELIAKSGVYFTPTVLIQGGFTLALAREPDLLLSDARFVSLFPPFVQDGLRKRSRDAGVERSRAVVAPMFQTIDRIHERGGKIVAGTDSPIVPYGLGLLLEIEQLSEAGLGPMAAIESATRIAAEALGAGKDLGTVEGGKLADLVLLGGDPTEDIKNLRKTELLVVNGKLLSVAQILRAR
jgi:Tol biopolymer transport system component/imidazolonepropionase-like amidohydrolase